MRSAMVRRTSFWVRSISTFVIESTLGAEEVGGDVVVGVGGVAVGDEERGAEDLGVAGDAPVERTGRQTRPPGC